MHSVTSNAVYNALTSKLPIITVEKPLGTFDNVQSILDFFASIEGRSLVPDGDSVMVKLGMTGDGGWHSVYVGSTNSTYFSITIFSFYFALQSWQYANGTWYSNVTNSAIIGDMTPITSNAVANIMQSAIALVDAGYNKIDASRSNFIWRSATLCSINIYDNTKTGISIDFDFGTSQIRVYTVLNGVTMGQKNVNLS